MSLRLNRNYLDVLRPNKTKIKLAISRCIWYHIIRNWGNWSTRSILWRLCSLKMVVLWLLRASVLYAGLLRVKWAMSQCATGSVIAMSGEKPINAISLYIKLIVIFRRITSKQAIDFFKKFWYNLIKEKEGGTKMFQKFKEFFKDDYIRTKRFRIKPFSLLWWLIRSGQVILVVAGFFVFYMMMWFMLA